MKAGDFLKRVLLAFGIALVAYAILYNVIEHRRAAKGPWQVTFDQEQNGAPTILVNQPTIGITNVQLSFVGATDILTNGPVTLSFSEARKTPFNVPFGKCVFLDTVFLPGTIVFEMAGYQVQLMPRVLTLDGVEHPWRSGEALKLTVKTNSNESPR